MKKVIIGISAVLVSAFVIILTLNAQNNPQENKKCTTEVSKDCSKGTGTSGCCKMKYGTTAESKPCDMSKCKEKGCDPSKCKEAKCSHEGCKANCEASASDGKQCDHAKPKSGSQN
jgi:hypothetical protein